MYTLYLCQTLVPKQDLHFFTISQSENDYKKTI